ncbi:MAG: DUF427 domain-containing protein [Candidatus Dormibacteraceae bacterium]
MSLTFAGSPLATHLPEHVNFTIDAPRHRLFLYPFPRRVRATFGGETVLDTDSGQLLYESNLVPQLYVPWEDVRRDLLAPTDRHTTCPFKGDADYWSLTVGDRTLENVVWSYPTPNEEATWLEPFAAFYWEPLDAWYDEEERVFGHLRDPFTRVDVRRSSRLVRVTAGDRLLAESHRAKVLCETGLPNRWYFPLEDCRVDLLTATETRTHCPYKGWASYFALGERPQGGDVAWTYERPFSGVLEVRDHLSFFGDQVTVSIEGHVLDTSWPPKNR